MKDAREAYYFNTGKAGDVGRQLALGGIAVAWLLHGPSDSLEFPRALLIALGAFMASIACDFLQYLGAATIWGQIQFWKEREFQELKVDPESSPSAEFEVSYWTNVWGNVLFCLKAMFLILGGVKLGVYIFDKVTMS